ncbi:hypothetical protein GQ457_07G007030 [Hibiscus cannabinus]
MAQTSAYMARTDRFIQKTDAFIDRSEIKLQNHDATLKSLETQVGHISQILNSRPIGGFPSDTEVAKGATHEKCNAITTRSGKILKNNQEGTAVNPPPAPDTPAEADAPAQAIHINLPLVEALQQMPNYAKFLKDMVTRKKRIEEFETDAATETCLALMHNKVPAKKTDPGSFTIECLIWHNYPTKALCDPGASINLMPKSVFQKLGIGEAKPTTVMLQLADHSYVKPEGKIEDILVKVDKFIFPTDFLILDCEADEYAPIILGRPFLSTSRAVIDFDNDEIIFKVENNNINMKSLTKKLNKGKNIADAPAKELPRAKLYMGAHVERDRAAIINGEPTRSKARSPRHRPNKGRPKQKNISSRYFTVGNSCKNASDFPARKQLAVKSTSETRLPNALENGRYLIGNRQIMNTAKPKYALVSAKSRWEEQGFYLDDALPNYGLEQFVHNHLRELGWFIFARQPARANYNWVLEFYANNADGEDSSMVRGRRVPATAAIINDIFGLPNDAPSFYAMMEGFEEEDYEVIKNILCQPNTEWNTTGRNPNSISLLSFLPEAKLWNTFVKRNLLPTSHNQTVDRTRLLLINTIMTGFRVNVGEILANELAAHCANDKGILAFPCLISALYRRANVPMFDNDKYQPEKNSWTRAIYMRKMNVVVAEPLNMVMPTPPASPIHEAEARVEDPAPPSPAEPPAMAEQHRTPPSSPLVFPVSSHITTSSPSRTQQGTNIKYTTWVYTQPTTFTSSTCPVC